MNTTIINQDLQKYLSKIKDKSINTEIDGYFPIDVVIDAFSKGEEIGKEKAIQNFKDVFIRKSTQAFLYGINLCEGLANKGYEITDFYINPFRFKVIVSTSKENTYDETFINDFYSLSYDYEARFRKDFGSGMEMMFIRNNEINEHGLEIDGFIRVSNGKA